MSSILRSIILASLAAIAAAPALADGDAAAGEKVFKKCAACHSVDPAKGSKIGPNLHGVVGRKTGTLESFSYSKAMLDLGVEGHVWTAEELDKYLENPKKMVSGTKMAFAGLKKPEERADVVAYLLAAGDDAAAAPAADPAEASAEAPTEAPPIPAP